MNGIRVGALFNVPIHVSLWYGLLVGYLCFWNQSDLRAGLLLAVCLTISVLVHEFGHAMTARHFKLQPRVLLHGLGGLCAHERAKRDRDEALIIAAGPAAGLALAGVVWLAGLALGALAPAVMASPVVRYMHATLIWINILLNLLNLLPLWPLDGGQLLRLGLLQKLQARRAERLAHQVGLVLGAGLAVYAVTLGMSFGALLAGGIAILNMRALLEDRSVGAVRPRNRFARELLEDARGALEAGDAQEAARLCHQLRALSGVEPKTLAQAWEILTVATARQGDHEQALRYARHAPETDTVIVARLEALVALGRREEARRLLAAHRPAALPEALSAALAS